MYADDTQLYNSVDPSDFDGLIQHMENCVEDVKTWMVTNRLKMNEEKTEVLFFDPKRKCNTKNRSFVMIENEKVHFTDKAKNLGVYYFDSMLSMKCHINNLCKTLYYEL